MALTWRTDKFNVTFLGKVLPSLLGKLCQTQQAILNGLAHIAFVQQRFFDFNYWFAPIGLSLGIKNTKSKRAIPNDILESAYRAKGKIKHKQIVGLAKQLDWSERQVERWLRLRRSQDRPSTLSVTSDCWWYYMISLAFYWSLTVSQFFDVKRKDFWQMFIHHIATISLMAFSWVCNLHRIGTLVLVIHDCADIFLEDQKQQSRDRVWPVGSQLGGLGVLGLVDWSTSLEQGLASWLPAWWAWSERMEGDIRSSSSEVSDEPSSYDPTGTNSYEKELQIVYNKVNNLGIGCKALPVTSNYPLILCIILAASVASINPLTGFNMVISHYLNICLGVFYLKVQIPYLNFYSL
uniref:TLC domain-containing protein n=1 Tax=Timema genevievae TaxID=629358 RepID=A0A7R9PP30_TIMGE|nr:unnamed protein product [Timema genevievae]